jgi:diguanylate cyclase (GGDEF)-like protein
MIDLAGMTRHMPDLDTYLDRVVAILRQLDYDDAMLFLVDEATKTLRLAAHTGDLRELAIGYRLPFGVGVAGRVARTGEPLSVQGVRAFPGQTPRWPAERGAELAVPLVVETELIGVLSVAIKEEAFSKTDEAVLTLFAERVAVAVHVAQLHAAARRAAVTDGLTGLLNHRAFYEELERAVAAGTPLSVVLFDVEGLKAANDSGGHLAGDALLRRVADTIRAAVRAGDVVARYGGDEFGALLFGADLPSAHAIAARVRDHLLYSSEGVGSLRTTVRYGVAVFPDEGAGPYELVGVADARLYEMRARVAGEHGSPVVAGRA